MNYSKIIAGTMTWGIWGKQLATKDMAALIANCVTLGITTFDHADIYGGYTTESDFGKAFKDGGVARADIQLISKCGIQLQSENRNNSVKHYNYDKNYIIWSVENTLKNLQTDYLDLLLLHRPSPLMHPEAIAEAVTILKTQGKINAFGVSNFSPSQMALIGKNTDISANQIEFSLTQHSAMNDGTLDNMMTNKVCAMAWSPLGSMFKAQTPQTARISNLLVSLQDKYSATEAQLLLAWLLMHPAKIHPLVGTTRLSNLQKFAEAQNLKLDLEDWFLMLQASTGHEVP